MKHASTRIAAALLIGCSILGCESQPQTQPKPRTKAVATQRTRADDAADLVKSAGDFDASVEQMPGTSAEDHRQLLLSVLDELPLILRVANGTGESPAFHNRLDVIISARKAIDDSTVDRRRMEAAENQALQAAGPALAGIAARYWSEDDQLAPLLQVQTDKITIATSSIGPMHDIDATNAFVAVKSVVDRIAVNMKDYYLP